MRKDKKVQNTPGLGIHIDHEKGTSQQWHTSTKRWATRVGRLITDVLRLSIRGRIRMKEKFLRRREAVKITGLSYSTIYRQMPKDEFPRQLLVGPRAVRWRASDIRAWMDSRPWG